MYPAECTYLMGLAHSLFLQYYLQLHSESTLWIDPWWWPRPYGPFWCLVGGQMSIYMAIHAPAPSIGLRNGNAGKVMEDWCTKSLPNVQPEGQKALLQPIRGQTRRDTRTPGVHTQMPQFAQTFCGKGVKRILTNQFVAAIKSRRLHDMNRRRHGRQHKGNVNTEECNYAGPPREEKGLRCLAPSEFQVFHSSSLRAAINIALRGGVASCHATDTSENEGTRLCPRYGCLVSKHTKHPSVRPSGIQREGPGAKVSWCGSPAADPRSWKPFKDWQRANRVVATAALEGTRSPEEETVVAWLSQIPSSGGHIGSFAHEGPEELEDTARKWN
ncbi:hypothetical protein B0H12DRAFT_1069031 [Mycena haematopus]|nr:hypothetical protein B0H12DRAFT_1069031 [Mycena haematopus]